MNDENIKEILARLSRYVITPDVRHDFDDLLDYITNLQQENERLKEIKPCMLNFQECYVVKDYKSRCEKASEYIKNNTHYYSTSKHGVGFVIDNENEEEFCNDLLNILQNGSDDNE